MKSTVSVEGGSLGGLFTGMLLHQAGWNVHIYERSQSELASRGGGIVLQPEVVRVFERVGLDPDGPAGVWANERIFLDREGHIAQIFRAPQKQTSWNAIFRALKHSFPSNRYHQGAELTTFTQGSKGVTATFTGAGQVESDLLIGADGGSSTVRQILMPDVQARYAGYVGFRGWCLSQNFPRMQLRCCVTGSASISGPARTSLCISSRAKSSKYGPVSAAITGSGIAMRTRRNCGGS